MKANRLILMLAAAFSGTVVTAQNVNDSENAEITLPDVSTVISGGAPKVGKSAVPDFSAVLPKTEGTEIVPRMPEAGSAEQTSSSVLLAAAPLEKTIYAEGVAGLGLPGFFTGNFSIYRQTGANPFKITFGHETVNGYANHSLNSGYFDKNTHIDAEKTFSTRKTSLFLYGAYHSEDNGLQNKSDFISDVTKDQLGAGISFDVRFTDDVSLKTSLKGDWYKRYGTVVGDASLDDYEEKASILDFNPEISFEWGTHGIYSALGVSYELEYDAGKSFDEHNANRIDFSVLFGWKNETVNVYAQAAAVVGNHIGDNDVVVPFEAGVDFDIPVPFSSRAVRLSAAGGIDSYLPKVSALEKAYAFSALNVLPEETSDWFGSLNVNVPVKDILTVTLDGVFRTTAFDNGTVQPVYKETYFKNGQYFYFSEDMTQVNTDAGISFRKGIATFSLNWKSFWGDVPAMEVPNKISGGVSLQDKKARVNFSSVIAFELGDDADSVPVVDFDCSVKVSDAVRLAVTGNDIVKLISGKSRDYAGEYIRRSGYAGILAKFFF